MIELTFRQAKKAFFDKIRVMNAVHRARLRELSKFGAYVRRGVRSSLRQRRRISAPGSPPSSHTGLLRNLIFFAYDAKNQSVVIGPALFRANSRVPKVLEYGGRTPNGYYRPRPFMRPGFGREISRSIPRMFANSVRRT